MHEVRAHKQLHAVEIWAYEKILWSINKCKTFFSVLESMRMDVDIQEQAIATFNWPLLPYKNYNSTLDTIDDDSLPLIMILFWVDCCKKICGERRVSKMITWSPHSSTVVHSYCMVF